MKINNLNIEFHITQSFPVGCLNRDINGTPKTAIIGDVVRARVSSQSWKRAIRMNAIAKEPELYCGSRSKLHCNLLKVKIEELGCPDTLSGTLSMLAVDSLTGGDTLSYLSEIEIQNIADTLHALTQRNESPFEWGSLVKSKAAKKKTDAPIKNIIKDFKLKLVPSKAVDIALFGRMLAKYDKMNIEGACSVAHAISTHEVVVESDFFTAVDDVSIDQGAGHLGVNEFTSATYYRYFSLNIPTLISNLEGFDKSDILLAVKTFVESLLDAIPNAKQTTMSARSDWDYGVAILRGGQPCQVSWDKAVKTKNGEGYSQESEKMLKEKLQEKEFKIGSAWLEVGRSEYSTDNNRDSFVDGLMNLLSNEI